MGTRSITVVKDKSNKKIIEMYAQYDGYPEGLGDELARFIESKEMVNGIGGDNRVFNGINCFAGQLIAHLKGEEPGGFYLHAPTHDVENKRFYSEKYFAEYYYEIDADLNIKCWDTYKNKIVSIPFLIESHQNLDDPLRHNISGSMNQPSPMQKQAFEQEEKKD